MLEMHLWSIDSFYLSLKFCFPLITVGLTCFVFLRKKTEIAKSIQVIIHSRLDIKEIEVNKRYEEIMVIGFKDEEAEKFNDSIMVRICFIIINRDTSLR